MKKSRTILIIIVILFVAAVLVLALVQKGNAPESENGPEQSSSRIVTVSGKFVCLPHKDTSGPQTMECAIGMQAEDGTYYALRDTTSDYSLVSQAQTEKPIRVTGTLTLEESDKYQSIGAIDMHSIEQL